PQAKRLFEASHMQDFLDAIRSALIDHGDLRQGINFVENQLPDLQNEVNSIQDQLEAFRRRYNFITPEIQSAQLSQQASNLSAQRIELDRQLAEVQQVFDNLQEQSGTLGALEGAPIYEQLLGELRSVESEIAQELTRFSPEP
ncbi:MAG: capsular biosynthesis protein, partial [Pseudomonadota bacterium]